MKAKLLKFVRNTWMHSEFLKGFGFTAVAFLISEPLGYFTAIFLITLNTSTQ